MRLPIRVKRLNQWEHTILCTQHRTMMSWLHERPKQCKDIKESKAVETRVCGSKPDLPQRPDPHDFHF